VQYPHPVPGEACPLEAFLPHLADLDIEAVIDRGTYLHIEATTKACARACLACGQASSRVHGRYRRLLQDLPAGGRPVLIGVTVRRLKCGNPDCRGVCPVNGSGSLSGCCW
jgi:transposase